MNTCVNEKMRVALSVLGILAIPAVAASCATTDMSSTSTDPSAKGAALSKIAIVCMTKDPGLRRTAEETAARR